MTVRERPPPGGAPLLPALVPNQSTYCIRTASSIPSPTQTNKGLTPAWPSAAKLREAVESVAPSAADTAKKAEPLQKGVEAGAKNLEPQSPLESTPLEQATKGQTQASKGKDVASE